MTEHEFFISRARARPPAKAPYTFIDAEQKVLASPVENLDLSRPVKDALSGCLEVSWKNDTMLLVGGGDAMVDPADNTTQLMNTTPLMIDGQYTLPGSTIKGLIRATMEIAAFARLSFVDDFSGHTHSYDDQTWKHEVDPARGDTPNGGWLFRVETKNSRGEKEIGYKLVQAERTERIRISQFVPLLPAIADVADWHEANMHRRQQAMHSAGIQGLSDVSVFGAGGYGQAQLAVAGQTADVDRTGDDAKNAEHLFFWPENRKTTAIDKATGDRFLASLHKDTNAHSGAPEANYSALVATGGITGFEAETPSSLEAQLTDPATFGLPVFWRNPGGDGQNDRGQKPILSLTALYRVPYKKTVHNLIAKTQGSLNEEKLDLVQALLGWAPPETPAGRIAERKKIEQPLRGRVQFGFAYSTDAKIEHQTRTWAAPRPRPSYWPYYLKAGSPNATHPVDYNNEKAILAGRKRYPARGKTQPLPGGGDNAQTGEHRDNMEQALTFLKPGATFTSKIRFRNISPIELGALVWAITFGDLQGNTGFRHMIGRAKTHGYGQVQARIKGDTIISHQGNQISQQSALDAFTDWVAKKLGVPFDSLPAIRQLKGAAHAATGARLIDYLSFPGGSGEDVLKAYGKLKKHLQESRNGIGGQPVQNGEIGLPPYPGVPEE